jgi:membrane associated rhomboid family serine protease
MVTLLIIANGAIYLANFLFGRSLAAPLPEQGGGLGLMGLLALYPGSLFDPLQWYRLVTYGFAHDPKQITHVLFNMLSLYFLGRNVEDKYGKWEFFRFYMSTIVVCGLVWALRHWGETSGPVLGASGATTGVAMLFVYSFPQATLYLYGALPVKAWVLGIIIIASNLFGSRDYVAYDVHLVGAGFASLYFFGHWNFSSLENLISAIQTRFKQRSRGLKVHRPEHDSSPNTSKDEMESDRILEKIHREGKDSLTARERSFLERYSREIREKRKQL